MGYAASAGSVFVPVLLHPGRPDDGLFYSLGHCLGGANVGVE